MQIATKISIGVTIFLVVMFAPIGFFITNYHLHVSNLYREIKSTSETNPVDNEKLNSLKNELKNYQDNHEIISLLYKGADKLDKTVEIPISK